jgi:hypothetical protein
MPLNDEQLARLRAEAAAPYRGLRQFLYIALAGSALLGAFVFLMKAITGEDLPHTLPNLLLQMGSVAILLWLWQREHSSNKT